MSFEHACICGARYRRPGLAAQCCADRTLAELLARDENALTSRYWQRFVGDGGDAW